MLCRWFFKHRTDVVHACCLACMQRCSTIILYFSVQPPGSPYNHIVRNYIHLFNSDTWVLSSCCDMPDSPHCSLVAYLCLSKSRISLFDQSSPLIGVMLKTVRECGGWTHQAPGIFLRKWEKINNPWMESILASRRCFKVHKRPQVSRQKGDLLSMWGLQTRCPVSGSWKARLCVDVGWPDFLFS